ncbi:hypothetical protein Q7A53_16865 [Halobacillus rhizosphaerae]|uniref:hypothetical protein n=1 Tax=Halobacillus rhizosphaerae TaxID=3064889 RepID=UPI00398B2F31
MQKNLMKSLSILLVLIIVACGRVDDHEYNADFQGVILEVKENSILVGEDDIDPEAQYPTYEVLIDDNTEISGEVERFDQLKKFVRETEHPIVHVWVKDKGKNNEIDHRAASKIIVEKE